MELSHVRVQICLLFLTICASIFAVAQGETVIQRSEWLHEDFHVSWTVDFDKKNVTFTTTGRTTGFIGFGFSSNGGMGQADVIMGGKHANGTNYFEDRFATGNKEPKIDEHQDWFLLEATENKTHTVLRFYRKIDTCDEEDLSIPNDTTSFIWSLGENDEIKQHKSRGSFTVNMFDKDSPSVDTSKFDQWQIKVNTTIPTRDTSYWCTLHQSKYNDGKPRHIVGFEVMLDGPLALEYNHHLILHKCLKNPADDIVLDPKGGECYESDGSNMDEAMALCNTFLYVWARGGKPLFLPENVGISMTGNPDEYFVVEIHYDNPKVNPNVTYETGVTVFTTTQLRNESAGVLTIGHSSDYNLVVPKETENFITVGHCSSDCTKREFPVTGINVFNVLLHSHLSGRKLKLRLFRNGTELPWISYDNNYDFNYQQNRPLLNELKLLPGDQITYECTYTTTWRDPPSVTLGGLSTRHEMCEAFLLYYPLLPTLDVCESQVPIKKLMEKFGIEELEETFLRNGIGGDPTVTKPANLSGRAYTDVIDNVVKWTPEFKTEFQRMVRSDPHSVFCYSHKNKTGVENVAVIYPTLEKEYAPEQPTCDDDNGTSTLGLSIPVVALVTFLALFL